ncbi:unnamed protein product [Ceratitis capitata]|uniref:(Mediterranean fruit fly) hypothetical protein n=1 Tax=Ceratitis capitata TaxID=7213 RepID=A0A811V786_CERCA|nr:unnamed protein product [Ceratitis capitata]
MVSANCWYTGNNLWACYGTYHKVKNAANVTLLLLMILGVYQHWMVSDPFERSGPALVFTFMLGGRLVVWYQTSRKEAELVAAAQPQTNGVKQD